MERLFLEIYRTLHRRVLLYAIVYTVTEKLEERWYFRQTDREEDNILYIVSTYGTVVESVELWRKRLTSNEYVR